MDIAKKFDKAGQKLAKSSGASIVSELNQILSSLLAEPFHVSAGTVVGIDQRRAEGLGTIVHTAAFGLDQSGSSEIPSDNVACVIDVSDCMNLEQFRAAYGRVVKAKGLNKTGKPQRSGQLSTRTLGIIFTVSASVSLETIANEFISLNEHTESETWPDMIVIMSEGVINFGVQFPGDKDVGDILPGADGALKKYVPALYFVPLMNPIPENAFRRMCSYLVPHLMLFAPKSCLADWRELKKGLVSKAISLSGYQYNLNGNLVAVPRQFHRDRYLPPLPHLIQDTKGDILAAVRYMPWQDGGVILLEGKLPLEGLMIFLLVDKPGLNIGCVQRPGRQISHVLPITQLDYLKWLGRIQRSSNMIVKIAEPSLIVTKLADEGTSTPFFARIFAGILKLRDNALHSQAEKDAFDKLIDRIGKSLMNARTTAQNITTMIKDHRQGVADNTIARTRGQTIQIDKNLDVSLEKEVNDFTNLCVRVLKHDMQELTKLFSIDIGFLFQKSAIFISGLTSMEQRDAALAAYLQSTRQWSEHLLEVRNGIEHTGWRLPQFKYSNNSGSLYADEPLISGQTVSAFVNFQLDRLLCFVEELTVHCLQTKLPMELCFEEILMSERPSEIPERFRLGLTSTKGQRWAIFNHSSTFDQT